MDDLRLGHLSLTRLHLECSSDGRGRARNLRKVVAHCQLYERVCDALSAKVNKDEQARTRNHEHTGRGMTTLLSHTQCEVNVDAVEVDPDSDSSSSDEEDGLLEYDRNAMGDGCLEDLTYGHNEVLSEDPFWSIFDDETEFDEECSKNWDTAGISARLTKWFENDEEANNSDLSELACLTPTNSNTDWKAVGTESDMDITEATSGAQTVSSACEESVPDSDFGFSSSEPELSSPELCPMDMSSAPILDSELQTSSTAAMPPPSPSIPPMPNFKRTRPCLTSHPSTNSLDTNGTAVTLPKAAPMLDWRESVTRAQWLAILPGVVSCFAKSLRDDIWSVRDEAAET